ncbi:MAG TPA: radical SAM protein [Puia sp.]|nr:radical SAM protein [Puia sp.]
MFSLSEYAGRGYNLIHNRLRPENKRLSSLMIYATDVCDSACRHCLIWAKRPATELPFESIEKIMRSGCVHPSTMVGLEGGEFLLHSQADRILEWFATHHRNYDLFSNCLQPDRLIGAVQKWRPRRLYISLDGDRETYLHMRGKEGYDRVIRVIRELRNTVPIFVMFTLSPYNDFDDLKHVAAVCSENGVFLRVGIYNNIPFFDTIEDAGRSYFGQHKKEEVLTYRKARALQEKAAVPGVAGAPEAVPGSPGASEAAVAGGNPVSRITAIPEEIKAFSENYDYLKLYENWRSGKLRLGCHSILDSVIVLPDGKVPICQHLDTPLGNIHGKSLDEIFNSSASNALQQHHSRNCNQCWVSYHRKYDIILYRTMERYFGRWTTTKLLGYYKWDADENLSYGQAMKRG